MFNLEVSADVSRQTPESHSGGRRFEPVQLHQFHQSLSGNLGSQVKMRVSSFASSSGDSLHDFSMSYAHFFRTISGGHRFDCRRELNGKWTVLYSPELKAAGSNAAGRKNDMLFGETENSRTNDGLLPW